MTTPLDAITDAYAQLANFEPENAKAIDQLYAGLPDMHTDCAAYVSALAQKFSSDEPIHQAVIEQMNDLASVHASMADHAAQTYATWRQVHAEQLDRIEGNAGPNEHKWDISQNQ